MKKSGFLFLCVAIFLCASGSASALLVDFTDADLWSGAEGEKSFEQAVGDWLDVKLEAFALLSYATLTFNKSYDGTNDLPDMNSDTLSDLAGDGDGIGIDAWYGDDDEVNMGELLKISFSPDAIVNSIYLLDLYSGETAIYSLETDWGTASGFATPGDGGFFEIMTGSDESVSWIVFSALFKSNFAVAGLDVSAAPVPEPASMMLLGVGLVGLAGVSRQKIFKK